MNEVLLVRDTLVVRLVAPNARLIDEVTAVANPHYRVERAAKVPWDFTIAVGENCELAAGREDRLQIEGEPARAYLVDPSRSLVTISEPTEARWQVQHVLRLLRSLFRAKLGELGGIFLHGSMVQWDGLGIAFVGAKRSGKTTSMLSMLAAGADFVANDDVTMLPERCHWTGMGSNRTVAVRDDTSQLSHLRECFDLGRRELAHPFNDRSAEQGYKYVRPVELARLFNRQVVLGAPLHVILFPRFREVARAAPLLRRLEPKEAAEILTDHLQPALDRYSGCLRALVPEAAASSHKYELQRLAQDVVCYEVEQSFQSTEATHHAVRELLKALP